MKKRSSCICHQSKLFNVFLQILELRKINQVLNRAMSSAFYWGYYCPMSYLTVALAIAIGIDRY
jgi:hypothetical protein